MSGQKLDMETMRQMLLFEKITHARVKDCFIYKDKLTFLLAQGQLRKALGRNNFNLEKVEKIMNRKIRLIEFNEDKIRFIINLLFPLRMLDIQEDEEGIITIKGPDTKTKGLIIGSRAQNLRATEEIVRKYFECKEIKVV